MKKVATCLIIMLFAMDHAYCQVASSKNPMILKHTVYGEVGGVGITYSINYDLLFQTNLLNRINFYTGAGFSYYRGDAYGNLIFPVRGGVLISFDPHHIQLGLNYLSNTLYSRGYLHPEYWYHATLSFIFLDVSYRFQSLKGGIFLKASFYPITYSLRNLGYVGEIRHYWNYNVNGYDEFTLYPWFGLSAGYTFKSKGEKKK